MGFKKGVGRKMNFKIPFCRYVKGEKDMDGMYTRIGVAHWNESEVKWKMRLITHKRINK